MTPASYSYKRMAAAYTPTVLAVAPHRSLQEADSFSLKFRTRLLQLSSKPALSARQSRIISKSTAFATAAPLPATSLSWGLRPHYQQRPYSRHSLRPCAAGSPATDVSTIGEEFKYVPAYTEEKDARNAVLRFYHAYNKRDLDKMMAEMADDVVYEDLVYDDAFVGAKVLREYLAKTLDVPEDLRFVMEDMTDGDGKTCGVAWHVELTNGTKIPFSRGASFYRVNDEGRIVFARDLVEALPKAGDAAFGVMKTVVPLLRMLGDRGITMSSQAVALPAIGMWAFYASYMGIVMLSDVPPGTPALQTSMDTIMEVYHESLNFFYVNIFMNHIGITLVPSVAEHPVSEALFNFVNAWSMMMLPAFLVDRKSEKMDSKIPLWIGTMFLTNVFCIPYMALREQQEPRSRDLPPISLPTWSPAVGAVAVAVGVGSLFWAVGARPEYGDLAARLAFLQDQFFGDRVFFAFVVDSFLYSVWQSWLMEDAPAKYRFVPFFGMAAWLLSGGSKAEEA